MPRQEQQVGTDLRQEQQTVQAPVEWLGGRSNRRRARYTEALSLTADKKSNGVSNPYANIYVRDDIEWDYIGYRFVFDDVDVDRVKYIDIFEVPESYQGRVTRQGDREGSTERAHYPIPLVRAVYYNNQSGPQSVHSHFYCIENLSFSSDVLRIEIPSVMNMWARVELGWENRE